MLICALQSQGVWESQNSTDAYVFCTVKGSENASRRMLWLWSRPPCNSAFDEDEDDCDYWDKDEDEDDDDDGDHLGKDEDKDEAIDEEYDEENGDYWDEETRIEISFIIA